MRHYYDSRVLPFLQDFLFDQLVNFNWETSRKEIEEERDERKERQNYLKVLDDEFNKDIKIYSPTFELVDGEYVYKMLVPKELNPKDLVLDATGGEFMMKYTVYTDNGQSSSCSVETLPEDLDVKSMKAVLKNGKLTVTAKQAVKEKEPEKETNDDVEFEIEIGK